MKKKEQDCLRTISNDLCLGKGRFPGADTTKRLENILKTNSDISKISETFTELEEGVAISPAGAAGCINHEARTKVFSRGLYQAILEAKNRFPGEKIKILYAGTGPFATLAIPQLFQFSKDEIEFVAIDIHKDSTDNLMTLLPNLQIDGYFPEIICDNAITHQYKGEPPHIVISETMDQGLFREPQAAITANFVPQMRDGGIFLPEKITISAGLISDFTETECKPIGLFDSEIFGSTNAILTSWSTENSLNLGIIFELTEDYANRVKSCLAEKTDPRLIKETFRIPHNVEDKTIVAINTEIKVFGNNKINLGETYLTGPIFLPIGLSAEMGGHLLQFRWRMGQSLGAAEINKVCVVI